MKRTTGRSLQRAAAAGRERKKGSSAAARAASLILAASVLPAVSEIPRPACGEDPVETAGKRGSSVLVKPEPQETYVTKREGVTVASWADGPLFLADIRDLESKDLLYSFVFNGAEGVYAFWAGGDREAQVGEMHAAFRRGLDVEEANDLALLEYRVRELGAIPLFTGVFEDPAGLGPAQVPDKAIHLNCPKGFGPQWTRSTCGSNPDLQNWREKNMRDCKSSAFLMYGKPWATMESVSIVLWDNCTFLDPLYLNTCCINKTQCLKDFCDAHCRCVGLNPGGCTGTTCTCQLEGPILEPPPPEPHDPFCRSILSCPAGTDCCPDGMCSTECPEPEERSAA